LLPIKVLLLPFVHNEAEQKTRAIAGRRLLIGEDESWLSSESMKLVVELFGAVARKPSTVATAYPHGVYFAEQVCGQ